MPRNRVVILFLATLLFTIPSRSTTLRPADKKSMLPEVSRKTLLNDLTTMLITRTGDDFILDLVIRNGAVFDRPKKAGTAWLAGRCFAELYRRSMELALRDQGKVTPPPMSVKTTMDGIHFRIQGPGKLLGSVGQTLAELLVGPEVPEDLFAKIKDAHLLELIKNDDKPTTVARFWLMNNLFAPFPYSTPASGTAESVRNITLRDIRAFYRQFFLPNSACLLIQGPFDPNQFRFFTSRYFGRWSKREATEYQFMEPHPEQSPKTLVVRIPKATQSITLIGGEWIPRRDPDYAAALIFYRLLHTRLDNTSQNHPGYQLSLKAYSHQLKGCLQISIQGPPQPDLAICTEVFSILDQLAKGEFSLDEFHAARQAVLDSFRKASQQADEQATMVLNEEWYRLGMRYFDKYPDFLDSVIKEDIQYLAHQYLSGGKLKVVSASMGDSRDLGVLPSELQPVSIRIWGEGEKSK